MIWDRTRANAVYMANDDTFEDMVKYSNRWWYWIEWADNAYDIRVEV